MVGRGRFGVHQQKRIFGKLAALFSQFGHHRCDAGVVGRSIAGELYRGRRVALAFDEFEADFDLVDTARLADLSMIESNEVGCLGLQRS